MRREPISETSEWTFALLEQYDREIASLAAEFGLDTYPNQHSAWTPPPMPWPMVL